MKMPNENKPIYFLGIDQGGTKTEAVVCDGLGRIIGKGRAAGLVDIYCFDEAGEYIKNIRDAAEQAAKQARIPLSAVAAVCGCLNGADWDFEYPRLCKSLYKAIGCADMTVLNDCVGAARAGTASLQRAVVCAGTGMNVAVRRADGKEIIYGYYIHHMDQGGNALGTAMLNAVADAFHGIIPPTKMTELLLSHTGFADVEALYIAATVGDGAGEPKYYAPLLLRALRMGDAAAASITDAAAERYAGYVTAAMNRLGIMEEPIDVVYSGSLFKDDGKLFAERVQAHINAQTPQATCVHARYEPVCGTLLTLLERYWNGCIPPEVTEAFDADAKALGLLRETCEA
jgi:N-acetylglucosamine kinase-like BadF-type ATPase